MTKSSSPGSWNRLLWRLRAETVAAEAGDFVALSALAAAASPSEPPPSPALAAEALHLHDRLVRAVAARMAQTARAMDMLRAIGETSPREPGRHLNLLR